MWTKCDYNTFYQIKKFNKTLYRIEIYAEENSKSHKIWVGLSSGTKRKHLENFEPDSLKRDGGIKALMWVKREILKFPQWLIDNYYVSDKPMYICIHWADSKRRDVYKWLEREGFYFINDGKYKILMKKL